MYHHQYFYSLYLPTQLITLILALGWVLGYVEPQMGQLEPQYQHLIQKEGQIRIKTSDIPKYLESIEKPNEFAFQTGKGISTEPLKYELPKEIDPTVANWARLEKIANSPIGRVPGLKSVAVNNTDFVLI